MSPGDHCMTDEQVARIRALNPDSIWRVPDGSYLVIRHVGGNLERLEVVDPKARGAFVWDFGPEGAP